MLRKDPRNYQIVTLSGLLLYGALGLDFAIHPLQIAVTLGTALATQWLLGRVVGLPRFDPKSPLISGLSLCLLLRTTHPGWAAAAAAIAVAGKFLIRRRGKHVFNPTNFALVALLLSGARVWLSPGQWGSVAFFAFLMFCAGGLVIRRAERSDVTYAFVAFWLLLLFGRALWLGDPPAIPLHQLRSGALLLFAFFMISDPKTTPDSRPGRIVFAALVAAGAGYAQFVLFVDNGLLYALVGASCLVPLIDRLLPGTRYQWNRPTAPHVGAIVQGAAS